MPVLMRLRRMIALGMLVTLFLVTACGGDTPQPEEPSGDESTAQQGESATPAATAEEKTGGADAEPVDEDAAPTAVPEGEGPPPPPADAPVDSQSETLSADAGRIAFMGPANAQGNIQAFVANSDGTGLRRASEGFGEGYFPSLSPDGSQVAFTAPSPDGDVEIYVVDVETGLPSNLTGRTGQDQQPVWSPDGSQIAFISEREGGDIDMWLMNADGSEPRRLAQAPGDEQLGSWSPDGSQIVFTSRNELGQTLFIIDVASGEITPLTEGEGREDGAPMWSPQGDQIVYFSISTPGGSPSLYSISPEGGEETPLDLGELPTVYPTWSPDGTLLGYTEVQPAGEWRIKAINLESGDRFDIPEVQGFMTSWREGEVLADKGITQGPQNTDVEVDAAVLEAAYKKGEPNAPVTIVEFSDYQCPFCQRWFNETLPQLEPYIEDGTVQLIFVDYPLGNHPQAPAAAAAARCAGEQGDSDAYWKMHDALFNEMNRWSGNSDATSIFAELGSQIGVDGEELASCIDSGRYAAEVQAGLQEGIRLGVTGTPTFFINGERVVGAVPFDSFAAYLP